MCFGAWLLAVASSATAAGPAAHASRGDCGGAGRGDFVGDDVHPVSESVFDGDESAVVRDVFYVWRSGDDGDAGDFVYGDGGVVAAVGGCEGSFVLVDAGRICLGDRGFVSAVCGEVCGDQPGNSAVEFESDLGIVVGRVCVWGIAWAERVGVCAGGGRVIVNDAGSGGDCVFVGDEGRSRCGGRMRRGESASGTGWRRSLLRRGWMGDLRREKLRRGGGLWIGFWWRRRRECLFIFASMAGVPRMDFS